MPDLLLAILGAVIVLDHRSQHPTQHTGATTMNSLTLDETTTDAKWRDAARFHAETMLRRTCGPLKLSPEEWKTVCWVAEVLDGPAHPLKLKRIAAYDEEALESGL